MMLRTHGTLRSFFCSAGKVKCSVAAHSKSGKTKNNLSAKPLKHQIQCELLVSNAQLALNLCWLKYTFQGLT